MKQRLSALNQRMFGNVGGAIKKIARVLCWIGIIASFIGGVLFAVAYTLLPVFRGGANFGWTLLYILLALLTIIIYTVVGGFLSWLGSLMTYGFGEIVEMAVRDRNRSGGARPQRSRAPAPRYARQTDDDWDGYRR